MPNPADSPDGMVQLLLPLLGLTYHVLERLGLPALVTTTLASSANLVFCAALIGLLVGLRRLATGPVIAGLLAVLATAVLGWIVAHPSPGFEVFFARGDLLAFAMLGGPALRLLPPATRLATLTLVSLLAHVYVAGLLPLGVVLAGMASGVASEHLGPDRGARGAAVAQTVIMGATFAACTILFVYDRRLGLGAQGLFTFMLLRHVSWVIDARRGAGGSLRDYWCYQLFYPCFYGATERYADFRARNPDLGAIADDWRLFRCAVRSAVYLWFWLGLSRVGQVPGDLPGLLAPMAWPTFAAGYLLMFVRAALFLMGVWSALEASALAWGVRIHPNFSGILAARTPSQFWYAWRGTMTRWLVEYVYIPLGGSRAHRVRNVFAVFTVSAAWHWMGVPFLSSKTAPLTVAHFAPIATWALVNATVLAFALTWRQRGWRLWPARTPALVRNEAARLGTWAFGGVTATFLGFQGSFVPRFPEFLLRLVGLG